MRSAVRCVAAVARSTTSLRAAAPVTSILRRAFSNVQYESIRPPANAEEAHVTNLLYNVPQRGAPSLAKSHVLTALLSNEPGVLSRVSGTLAGRGYNIDSLVVCATEVPEISRSTLVINENDAHDIMHIKRDLEDIVQVWAVVDYSSYGSVLERELLLCKVCVDGGLSDPSAVKEKKQVADLVSTFATRQSLMELTNLFGGKVLDLTNETLTIELSAKSKRIDAFLKLVSPFGIAESVRSGPMAMLRGNFTGFEEVVEVEEKVEVSVEDLPPG